MHDLLDFFSLQHVVPLVLLIALLHFVGTQMGGNNARVLWWARGAAAAGFLVYAGAGIAAWRPATAWEFLTLTLRALLAMGVVEGLARIAFAVVGFLYQHLWAKPLAAQQAWAEEQARQAAQAEEARAAAEQAEAERQRRADEERRRREETVQPPPPPTRDELLTAAKRRYDDTLRVLAAAGLDGIELQAAQEKAKQQYLREINELLK